MVEKYQGPPYNGTLKETRREEDQKIVGEDWLSKKRVKLNELNFLSADIQKWKESVDNLRS
jgi:hypothetical protein